MDETGHLAGLRKITYYISSPMVFLLAEDCCPDFSQSRSSFSFIVNALIVFPLRQGNIHSSGKHSSGWARS